MNIKQIGLAVLAGGLIVAGCKSKLMSLETAAPEEIKDDVSGKYLLEGISVDAKTLDEHLVADAVSKVCGDVFKGASYDKSTLPVSISIKSDKMGANGGVAAINNLISLCTLTIWPGVDTQLYTYEIKIRSVVGERTSKFVILERNWFGLSPLAALPTPGWADVRGDDAEIQQEHIGQVTTHLKAACSVLSDDYTKFKNGHAQYLAKIQDELVSAYTKAESAEDKKKILKRLTVKSVNKLPYHSVLVPYWKKISNQDLLARILTESGTSLSDADRTALAKKISDAKLILKLLNESDRNGLDVVRQKVLVGNLPKKDAEEYALKTIKEVSPFNYVKKGGVDKLRVAIMVASSSKDKAFVRDVTLELGKGIVRAREHNSWGWSEENDRSMKDLIKALPKMDAELLREFVKQDNRLWRFCDELIDANLAAQMLLNRECPTDEMEKAFLSKIPAEKIDIDLYDALVYKQTKEAAYGIMTNEVKEQLAKRHHDKIVRAIAVAEKDANELRQLFSTVKFNYSQTERLKSFIKERAFYFKNVTTWTVNCLGAPQGITRVAFKCSDDDANNILLVYVDFEGECKEAIRGLKPFDKVSFLGAGNKECSYSLGITLKGLIVDDKTSEDKMVDFIEKCGVTDAEIDAMLEDGESIVRRYAKSEGVEFPSEDAMKKAKSKASSVEEARKAVGDIRDVLEDIKEVKDEFDKAWSDAKSEANKTLNEVVNDKDVQELKRSMDELKSMTDALKGLSL